MASSRAQRSAVPSTGMRGGLGRTLLTAFLLLAIGPLSLIGYVAFSQVRAERQRETVDRLTALADLEEAWLYDWLQARQTSLTTAANDPNWSSWLTASDPAATIHLTARLKMILDYDPTFSEVYLVTQSDEEQWIAATTGQPMARPSGAVSPQGQPPKVRLQPSPANEAIGVELFAPVRADNAQPIGWLVGLARLELDDLPGDTFVSGHPSVVYLSNREHQTVTLRGERPTGLGQSQGAARALAGECGTAAYKNEDGVPVLGVYRWRDDWELALIVEQDQAVAFARSDELAAGLIGAVLGVALLTTIIAAAVTRQLTRPIVLLTEAALKMAGGDLSVRVQPTRRDEIGILGHVFNTMASELAGLYTGLELKVAERTRELEEAKEQIQYHAWQLSISAEIGRITTSILDLNTLLSRAADLIRDAFQLEHVGIYLLDGSGQVASLHHNVGRAVPAHERQLDMNRDHPVTRVIAQRMPRSLTRSNGAGRTCHELTLPLALGTRTLGALDLTTCDPAGFSESDQSVLQTLAGQLSVAIENARAYSQEHEAADEMREIDRLRGQFLMRMSHQLATYLNTILGFSKLLLKGVDGPLNETQVKDLTAIRQSGQQLAQLLDDILELASLEVGAVELNYAPVEIHSLIEGLRGSLTSLLVNPQMRLELQIEPDLPDLVADADRLRQVLTNLVMTASQMSHEGALTVQAARRGHHIAFQVSAPAHAAGPESDHAVSLALSRKLVDLHGGRLHVEQRRDDLIVFSFNLPINVREALPVPEAGVTGHGSD